MAELKRLSDTILFIDSPFRGETQKLVREAMHAAEDEILKQVVETIDALCEFRHEQCQFVINDFGKWKKWIEALKQQVEPALESPLCKCGHKLVIHYSGKGCCKMFTCYCEEFQQAEEEK